MKGEDAGAMLADEGAALFGIHHVARFVELAFEGNGRGRCNQGAALLTRWRNPKIIMW